MVDFSKRLSRDRTDALTERHNQIQTFLQDNVIWEFKWDYAFLSNFWIEADGSCVEVEYQQAKCANPRDAKLFAGLSPWQAKALGQRVRLRADWEQVKLGIMYHLVLAKFNTPSRLTPLGQQLLDTGTAYLEEGNSHGDTFWGTCNGIGHNHLGRILMRVRDEIIPF